MRKIVLRVALAVALAGQALAQVALRRQIAAIASRAQGKVAVACALTGRGYVLDCGFNAHARPPMQSVFKLPLALAAFHLIEQGRWTLDRPLRFHASDRILPFAVSPLQDKYPNAEVDIPFRELLRLTIVESDNAAADVVLRTVGGPAVVNDYMASLGIRAFHLQDDEAAARSQSGGAI